MATTLPADGRAVPSAIGGTYLRKTNSQGAWTQEYSGFFSRADLYAGVGAEEDSGLNGGVLKVEVFVRGSGGAWLPLSQHTRKISTFVAQEEGFFYDDLVRDDGSNAASFTVFQAPFDEYRVVISPDGFDPQDGGQDCAYRLNGLAVFEKDPLASPLPHALSTLNNLLDLQPESNEKDRRNHVTVVGARKAAVTDSSKYLNQYNEQNPNNPMPEFFVSVTADPFSIYDPLAKNFTGGKRATVIVDDKVADGEFARWLSRLVLYRYKIPKLSGSATHTALPMLELRDAVQIRDEVADSFRHLVWVTEFTETWGLGEASVTMQCSSYPELPSFTPREDVDLDLFGGRPVYGLGVDYLNLFGESVGSEDLAHDLELPRIARTSSPATGAAQALDAYSITDGLFYGKGSLGLHERVLVNHPYRRFWNLSWSGATPTVTPNFQEGDGTAGVYDAGYYNFPTGWNVVRDSFVPRTGTNPFYDPYTSEVGNLVRLEFDSLVSGLYRISVWARADAGDFDLPVAWLTDPSSDPADADAHWSYFDASVGNTLYWDGVDNIGAYNRYQSQDYARRHEGAFGEKPMAVGMGHYAWNLVSSALDTQIGDARPENIDYDEDGNVRGMAFTLGQYGRFYVRVEVKSDALLRRTGDRTPLEVNTAPKATDNPHGQDPEKGETGYYIYTHLGEPTQAYIQPWEWTGGAYTEGTSPYSASWAEATDDIDALLRTDKPVKFTFRAVPRRGLLFRKEGLLEADPAKWSAQIHRQAHLKATVFDAFWTFFGRDWQEVRGEYRGIEEKRLTTRMYHNEDHTLEFVDEQFKDGDALTFAAWVFSPKDFRKDFGAGIEEELRFGDYEQLEIIPGFDPKRGGGTARADRSHFLYGFVNYLFYFSAFTQDRSGRRQWCVNPAFVDRTKIVTPAVLGAARGDDIYGLSYERLGADEFMARSLFVREWTEPGWATGAQAGSPVSEFGISDTYQMKFIQPRVDTFDIYTGALRDTLLRDETRSDWLKAYGEQGTNVNDDLQNRLGERSILDGGNQDIQNPTIGNLSNYHQALPALGNWTFGRGQYPLMYKPTPGIDFHPFWTKMMPDFNHRTPHAWDWCDVLSATGSCRFKPFRDVTAKDSWYGWAEGHAYSQGNYQEDAGARVEDTAQRFLSDAKDRRAQAEQMFDMQRIDTLDRFDQYRGVISRGEFKDRDESAAYWDSDADRIAAALPVKPAGTHLLNLGRYSDYIVGPIHKKRADKDGAIVIHSTEQVRKWFDLRFPHEYIWYNDRYFPIAENGGSAYQYFRRDYTRATLTLEFWNPDLTTTAVFFDAGAWTGWKTDRTAAEWAADPYLRWMEFGGFHDGRGIRDGGSESRAAVTGGYDTSHNTSAFASTGKATARRDYQSNGQSGDDGRDRHVVRENIFEGPHGQHTAKHRMRLAVGPEGPEARLLTMNLVLPERLAR